MRNRIGKRIKGLLAALGGAALVMGLFAPLDDAAAQSSIKNTRHNLGSGGTAGNPTFSGTDEVCVFCHTPHAASTGAGNPPLWNKNLTNPVYTVYSTSSSSTIDGTLATDGVSNAPSVGSVSIACLSCHDGTQAMSNLINAPGSGLAGDATWAAGAWSSGSGLMGGVANLGIELRNDHPIGIQYCGGGYNAATAPGSAATTCGDKDFTTPLSQVIGGTRVFWVETGGDTTRNKTDMILYNRGFGGANPEPSVECATCHDPHVENVAGSNPTFLRKKNTASQVCLACHVK